MEKILIKKEKKEYVKDLERDIVIEKQRTYYVKDISKDFHCNEGVVVKKDLKKKDGALVKANTGKEFFLLTADFLDHYKRIERMPQIISLKDLGLIITHTGINKNSRVIDAGTGSGALSCFLAHLCKEVISYDIRDDFLEVAKKNKGFLGLKNLKIKKKDVYTGFDEKDVDVVVLDLPEPWNALEPAAKALKIGGYLVSYSPTIPQTADFVNAVKKHEGLFHLKTIELVERPWEIEGRKVRPSTKGIGHTGFLSFCRRIS